MNQMIKTEAIVLKTIKYGDTSKIVTFFTRSHGKIVGILKGVRSQKKKYGSPVDILSYVSILFYYKEGRDIQTVSNCDTLVSLHRISEDITKMYTGMTICELIYKLLPQHEANPFLFEITTKILRILNGATKYPLNLLYYFEYHFAKIMGFEMSVQNCGICKKPYPQDSFKKSGAVFDITLGSIICNECKDKCRNRTLLTGETVNFIYELSVYDAEHIAEIFHSEKVNNEIEKFFWNYLRFHNSELGNMKSRSVFKKILKG